MIGWNFPSNGGGLIRGVAEAGIQTFTGKEISSLAREVCQNSLDAIVDENSAVTVEFQLHKIFSRNIPGCNDYKTVLSKCRDFCFQQNADDISAGIGYYGETQKNMPVPKISALENISQRLKGGTDIFIYGFNGGNLWRENIFVELMENFLVAIFRDKLRVNLQGLSVDKNNLGELLNKYADKIPNASNYYRVLTGVGVKFFEKDFHGMGKLKLGVLLDNKISLNRKVLIVRKSGMKLFELDRISRTMSFTGILELEGRELNEFFREMETPAHDKWEPSRYEKNPKLAKEYLAELKRWVRETIQGLGEENISEEVNVEGLSHMLDFDDGAIEGDARKVEALDNPAPPEIELIPVTISEKTFSGKGGNDNSKTKRTVGNITDKKGDSSAIRKLGGTRKRKTSANHTGEKNPDGENTILEPDGQKIGCNKIRVVKFGKKTYTLILEVSQNISSRRIEVFAVGEDNSHEKLSVTAANSNDANSQSRAENGEISFRNMRTGAKVKINFELLAEKNYALGVAVYED